MAEQQHPRDATSGPGLDAWRRLVETGLNGRELSALQSRTRDGIVIEPLYASAKGRPPLPGRGARAWSIVQIVDDPDPEKANRQALEDLAGGASGLAIRFAGAPSANGFGLPAGEAAFRIALDGVDAAAIHLRIDPHPQAAATALWLRDLVLRQGIAPERADVAFGLDPVGALAFHGADDGDGEAQACAGAFRALAAAGFRGPFAALDARVCHEAGASEAQELAAVLGAASWWLRALEPLGIAPEAAFPCFGAAVAVDRDQFLSIAKIRALRLLWSRLLELCGAPPTRLPIHGESSRRMTTRADPHGNLLRATLAAFAAGAGGADSLAVLPFDAALGLPSREARALARNMQHLLIEETQLHRVADPGAGSGAVEALTDALAERAWAEFQSIEQEGGIVESLRSGAFQARIGEARQALSAEVRGQAPLVGVTVHRQPEQMGLAEGTAEATPDPGFALSPVSLEALARAAA